jgi:hypothetical protein
MILFVVDHVRWPIHLMLLFSAPNNDAFTKWAPWKLEYVNANANLESLQTLAQHHIAQYVVDFQNLYVNEQITTLDQSFVSVVFLPGALCFARHTLLVSEVSRSVVPFGFRMSVAGTQVLGLSDGLCETSVRMVSPPIKATNGYIQEIDTILQPSGLTRRVCEVIESLTNLCPFESYLMCHYVLQRSSARTQSSGWNNAATPKSHPLATTAELRVALRILRGDRTCQLELRLMSIRISCSGRTLTATTLPSFPGYESEVDCAQAAACK